MRLPLVILWRHRLLGHGLALGGVLLVATTSAAGSLDASWIAPTTNADGSPLTDLASYRIYYGTFGAPCPGGSFLQLRAPSPSPALGEIVTARLTGLSTGTLYNVSVTAVDLSGNESDCSIAASAVARIDFAVSPTGTVNFGSVNVGSIADQVFTVSNTGGGTVAGTVSVPAPFSIVSGSPFSLVGLGATQAVTVRFTPTTASTATANVNFTAGGATISRSVTGTGTGIAPDPTPPTVAITTPTSGPTYSASLRLAGTASDNVGVTQVTWANSRGGGGTATGTTSWMASGIVLQLGTNVVTVTARDLPGNTATASFTVTRIALTFTDDPLEGRDTLIQAVHVTELRAAIESLRVALGLAAFPWTDPTLTPASTSFKAVHLTELRTALSEAYQAVGLTPPMYSDPTVMVGVTVVRATHLNEVRAAVRALN